MSLNFFKKAAIICAIIFFFSGLIVFWTLNSFSMKICMTSMIILIISLFGCIYKVNQS
jgi:uncharacterized membrane protein YqjE